jgi:hypothetical protein
VHTEYEPKWADKSTRTLPDAAWIRKNIPIADVARKLGLQGDERLFYCFRPHPPGKRKRSLSVHPQSNTIRCFTCDKRSMSNIYLVMNVRGCSVGEAIKWISEHFKNLPTVELRLKRGRKSYAQNRARPMTLQNLITSEGWTSFSPAAKIILTAIFAPTPAAGAEQGCLHCTYDGIKRWTGIRGRATVAGALQELRNAKAIQTDVVPTNFRTKRGFWLKETFVRVDARAMRAPRASTTSTTVQKVNLQYTVQKLNSGLSQIKAEPGKEGFNDRQPGQQRTPLVQ